MSASVCCYKKCTVAGTLDARIEAKTVLPTQKLQKKIQDKFLVNWKSNGEAEFHVDCWEKLLQLSRSRKTKAGPGEVWMVKEEKALVRVAAEAPEQFDSRETVAREAERVADWIKQAKHSVAFTGAGISTSAGIGDYRGKAGKWTEEDQNNKVDINSVFTSDSEEPPQKKSRLEDNEDDNEQEEAYPQHSGERYRTSGPLVTFSEEGVPYEKLRPTYTHEALVKLMDEGYLKYIISQNGDGLHGLSGVPKDKISELHGNVFIEICELCGSEYDRKFYVMDDVGSQYYEEIEDFGKTSVKKPAHAKKCQRCGLSHRTGRKCEKRGCGGYLMDTVINFRDLLGETILDRAKENSRQCDMMLCLGTTLQVTPAADLVKKMKNKNRLVICNRQETPLDIQFEKKGASGESCGSRIFGDCDVFMREVMKHVFSTEEFTIWDSGREERMKKYNELRDSL